GNAFRKISALAAPVAIPKQQGLTRQQALGRLGGKCAGSIGENKFAVEVAADGRSRCQLRTCKVPLKIGELRLGKRPPSLRHGQNKKCTWYHPECAMVAFAACSKKSRVVERVEDIDYGFESLSAKDQQRIRKAIANRPVDKSVVQRKPSSKPRKCHKVPIVHAIDTDTSCASSLDERVGRLTDDEDVDEKPSGSISMLRAAGSFVMSPSNPPPAPTEVAEELASFAFGGSLDFNEAMSSEMQDEPFYRDAFYRSPSRLEEALSAPLPPSPPGQYSLLRPQLNDGTVDWPQVPLDQLVDVAITGPLALVACDDDVETVSGDVDVDFADP
ncbi:unnamed protein product, partial [Pelagomonas calceolata]